MKKLLLIGGGILILTALAFAQTSPNFVTGQIPTAAQWNSIFAGKADTIGGHLTNPVIDNAQMNGTTNFANPVTFSGGVTYPGALTAGSLITSGGGSLGGTFTGSPTFSGAPSFTGGGSLSGTFTGNPNLSGAPIFTGTGAVVTLPAVGAAQAAITGLPAGDCTTDDTTALNTFLALHPNQTVLAPANCYRVVTDDLKEAIGQTIVGSGNATISQQQASGGTTFAIDPAHSFIPAGSLYNVSIIRDGLITNPTAEQLAAEVAQWAADESIGVYAKKGGPAAGLAGNMTFDHVFVGGFNTGFDLETGQWKLSDVLLDDWNGVYARDTGSRSEINHTQPGYWLCRSNCDGTVGSEERDGIAFYMAGGSGVIMNDTYPLGYAQGYVTLNVSDAKLHHGGAEWNVSTSPNFDGVGGAAYRVLGSSNFKIDHSSDSTYMEAINNTSSGGSSFEQMRLGPPPAVNGQDYIFMGGATATPTAITLTGTPAVGNTITVTVTSAALDSTQTIVYTVSSRDMGYNGANQIASIVNHLTFLINQNLVLAKARFWANTNDSTNVTVLWPTTATATVTAVATGSLSAGVASGTAFSGSNGKYDSISTPAPNTAVPLFNADSGGVLAQQNLVFNLNPIGGLWAGWFNNYPANGKVVVRDILFNGNTNAPIVTGTGCSLLSGSTDGYGRVTATTSATTCTVSFSIAWPGTPTVMVAGQKGDVATITAVSASAFTFTMSAPGATEDFAYTVKLFP